MALLLHPDRQTQAKGEKIAGRIMPQLHQFIAERLWSVKIGSSVKRDLYGNYHNQIFPYYQLEILMTWNGLCDRLRMSSHSAYYKMAVNEADIDWTVVDRLSEETMLKDAFKRIEAEIKIQERRRDIVSRGGHKAMRLDPVLDWHLKDQNIDANAFKYLALCEKKPMGITVAIKDDLISGRVRLSPEVLWNKGVITISGVNLPITLAQNFIGGPAIKMIEHPALANVTIKTIKNKFDKARQKAAITVQTVAV